MIAEIDLRYQEVEARRQLFEELYEQAFPVVARLVRSMGGTYEQASDVFQDALVAFYEKLAADSLSISTSPEQYVAGIAKHLCLRRCRDAQNSVSLSQAQSAFRIIEEKTPSPLLKKIMRLLESSGQRCLDLLQAFYFDQLSMRELSARFGFKSERSATVQKFKCVEKLRNEVKSKMLSHEDFLE